MCLAFSPIREKKKNEKINRVFGTFGIWKNNDSQTSIKPRRFELRISISAASRESRGEEANGKDYYFISTEEFKQHIKNDDFLEWEEVYRDNFYGTLKARPHLGQRKNVILILTLLVDCESNLNLRH
jgi:guanylate kinase